MCLIAFHWQPGHSLVLSANRDEFFQRATAPLAQWSDQPTIYAGRDLSHGGTWLGVSEDMRFAALTNVRAPGVGPQNPPSRGELPSRFLLSQDRPEHWAKQLLANANHYAPFNLLVGDAQSLWYISNYPKVNAYEVLAGTHALSNAQLDIPWPKVQLAMHQLDQWRHNPHDSLSLAQLLNQREPFADEQLPDTGVPLEWERSLSAQFIHLPNYGTRCSTGLIMTPNEARITEVSWDAHGQLATTQQLRLTRQ